jgi:Rrf2 family iron-sulfur cluster assembly transcriptional regulator
MKLSTRSRYGTRLLVHLARHQNQGPVQIGDIAKRENISVKYLEQIIQPLKKSRLVTSMRGPKGGHLLAQRPENITLGQIVRLLEDHTDLVECVSHPETCNRADDCRIRLAWQEAIQSLFERLDSITIAELMAKYPSRNPDDR